MTGLAMRLVRGLDGETRHVPAPYLVTPAKPARGRKARVVPDPIKTNGESAAEELRLLIERGERIEEEIAGMLDDRRDFFAEAKGRGYDPKAVRAIMALRKKDRGVVAEEEAILELYRQHLGLL